MLKKEICYINYINKKFNNGEIRHQDFYEDNFEYRNIVEINKYDEEPIGIMDFISKYGEFFNIIIINMNNVDKNTEEIMINSVEAVIEYLESDLGIKPPKIIYINRKVIINNYKPDIKG